VPQRQGKPQTSNSSLSGQVLKQTPGLRAVRPPRRSNPAYLRRWTGPGAHLEEKMEWAGAPLKSYGASCICCRNTFQRTLGCNQSWRAWAPNGTQQLQKTQTGETSRKRCILSRGFARGAFQGPWAVTRPGASAQDNHKTITRQSQDNPQGNSKTFYKVKICVGTVQLIN
jgi:hypothetical protein